MSAGRPRRARPSSRCGTSAPTTAGRRCFATSTSRSTRGEMVCLLGGNASGKTTTLKTILGYVTPSEGEVLLDGDVVSGMPDDRGRPARRLDGARRTAGSSRG